MCLIALQRSCSTRAGKALRAKLAQARVLYPGFCKAAGPDPAAERRKVGLGAATRAVTRTPATIEGRDAD